jgi:hypothetical protein
MPDIQGHHLFTTQGQIPEQLQNSIVPDAQVSTAINCGKDRSIVLNRYPASILIRLTLKRSNVTQRKTTSPIFTSIGHQRLESSDALVDGSRGFPLVK